MIISSLEHRSLAKGEEDDEQADEERRRALRKIRLSFL